MIAGIKKADEGNCRDNEQLYEISSSQLSVFSNSEIKSSSQGFYTGEVGAGFISCDAECENSFALLSGDGQAELLTISNCSIRCGGDALKSLGRDVCFIVKKSTLSAETGVILSAQPGKAEKPWTADARFENCELEGDIICGDGNCGMSVSLTDSSLKGVISGARLTMDEKSLWYATGDSAVTLVGDFSSGCFDAPKGVEIAAKGGENRRVELPCGGIMVIRKE